MDERVKPKVRILPDGHRIITGVLNGRIAHCIDIRESQADLMHRRYLEAKDRLSRSGVGHS